jgi:hypothetical protein
MKKVFEQTVSARDVSEEDGGCAKILDIDDDGTGAEEGMFVRVQSWSEEGEHPDFDNLIGKRVRVTIEVLD